MDHPGEHMNDAVLPVVPFEKPVRENASTSASPGIQAPSLPQNTPAFQVPSHSQHEDNLPQRTLTAEQKEAHMRIYLQFKSQETPVNQVQVRYLESQHVHRFSHNMDHPSEHINDAVLPVVPLEEPMREAASTSASPGIQAPSLPQATPAFQVPSHSQHEDYLPQLTAEQKEELMRIHTEITSQENPVNQVTSFEFEEPRDQTDVYNAIFKEPPEVNLNAIWGEPQDEADVSNAISEEPQDESDDSKSVSEEGSGQEEWTPQEKRKQGKPKSNVKRKYTKQNRAKTQGSEGS